MSAPLLQLNQVQYTYEQSGFTLACPYLGIEAGEAALIRGANGSGKTTLGKLLAGILKPQQGELLLQGVAANNFPLGRMGQAVGYLFQEPIRQLFCTTVGGELLFKARFLAEDIQAAQQKAESLLQRFGLAHLQGRSVCRLSRGEKQRLALAAVMMQEPKLLLLDEPFSGLDQAMRQTLAELLDELLTGGMAVIIISHERQFSARFSQRVIAVESGVVRC